AFRPLRRRPRTQPGLALSRHPDALSVGLLALLSCAVFRQSLSGRLVITGYDLSLYAYPYRVAVAEAIRHWRLPFWNPHVYLGVPLLANIPSAVFYPFNLAFVLTTRPQLLTADMLLHVWLAGPFFYVFGRRAPGS